MKYILPVLLTLLGCAGQDQQPHSGSSRTSLSDSAALVAYEDSILSDPPASDVPAVLPNGDTLIIIAGSMMWAPGAKDFGTDHYVRGGTHYLRITKTVGTQPNGRPIFSTRARLRLPPVDSSEGVVIQGLCLLNGKEDPFVLGIAGTVGDSVQWQARHAWRFDLATETLHEIPTTGVRCAHVVGED